jgi:hypothetical protein
MEGVGSYTSLSDIRLKPRRAFQQPLMREQHCLRIRGPDRELDDGRFEIAPVPISILSLVIPRIEVDILNESHPRRRLRRFFLAHGFWLLTLRALGGACLANFHDVVIAAHINVGGRVGGGVVGVDAHFGHGGRLVLRYYALIGRKVVVTEVETSV